MSFSRVDCRRVELSSQLVMQMSAYPTGCRSNREPRKSDQTCRQPVSSTIASSAALSRRKSNGSSLTLASTRDCSKVAERWRCRYLGTFTQFSVLSMLLVIGYLPSFGPSFRLSKLAKKVWGWPKTSAGSAASLRSLSQPPTA